VDRTQLGPYQIEQLLGRGSAAVVYKALQPSVGRYVALKVLLPHGTFGPEFRARFEREAQIVAGLDHPNILPLYDFGRHGEVSYMVMPLVSGGTLREWLGRSIPLERALQVFSRLLSALEFAHTQQPPIIHRDVKPSNVLMGAADWPLLGDFGIAKLIQEDAAANQATRVGTPEYMAPEQGTGRAVDARTDVYAMGIILYKILTGRVPFQGQGLSSLAVIRQHVEDPVPMPGTLNPAVSPVWDEVIRRSLAKEPNDRYSSALAMDAAVQAAWRQVQHEGGAGETVWVTDPIELYECAVRAVGQANWPRAITLCGEILQTEASHPEAAHLLTQAYDGLRWHGARGLSFVSQGQPASSRPSVALLCLRQQQRPARVFVLDERGRTLGRALDNDIVLEDAAVSRQHCRVYWAGDGYALEDLGSSNGTYLNGALVQSAPLRSGDLVELGDLVFEFTSGPTQAPADTRAAEPDAAGLGASPARAPEE
jgi:eukaryotic-like serine/threonine-protein kinase